jgi:hypothetical protein
MSTLKTYSLPTPRETATCWRASRAEPSVVLRPFPAALMTRTTAAYPASSTLEPSVAREHHASVDVDSRPARGMAQRFLDRFVLIAFGLYHLPLFLNNYPSLGGGGFNDTGLAVRWGHVFTVPGIWVARHLFHMTGPMTQARSGDNGDVGEEFARLLLSVVIGLVAASVWTAWDRARPRAGWVRETTRVMLRYSIALGIASYAVAKLIPMQFPALSPFTLEQRVGELRPMTLLWTFMEYSRPYAFFGGVMELVAVLLLCFRRTATLGAIVCVAVMSNVMMMNIAYDVPVKLYATMTVVSAAVLVLYDLPRLTAFFLTNRTAPPAEDSFFHQRIGLGTRWVIKVLAVGSVIVSSVAAMRPAIARRASAEPMNGPWEVTSFTRNGVRVDSTADPSRWRRMFIDANSVIIRLENDSVLGCGRMGSTTLALSCARGRTGSLQWLREGDILSLTGTFDGAPVQISAQRINPAQHRLLGSGFHVISDR